MEVVGKRGVATDNVAKRGVAIEDVGRRVWLWRLWGRRA